MDFNFLFSPDTIITSISTNLNISSQQIGATIKLLEEDNSIPFIARYRKDITNNLNEIQLRDIKHEWDYLNSLNDLKKHVYGSIDEQKKLTPLLIDQLIRAKAISEVNDLYAPFKRVRKTKADIAKENGLGPLAEKIINLDTTPLEELVAPFLTSKILDESSALQGAVEILSDQIGHDMDIKNNVREVIRETGVIQVKISEGISPTDEKAQVYKDYFDYQEEIKTIASHRILAINRAIKEGILDKRIDTDSREDIINNLKKNFIPENETSKDLPESTTYVSKSISHAYTRYLAPSAKAGLWLEAREDAFKHAIAIFAKNVENLLLTPPIKGHTILGLDPAYRTGCKTAIVNSRGKLINTDVLYLHDNNSEKKNKDTSKLNQLISENGISLIVIGDGTASRETEEIVVSSTARQKANIPYLIVSEAGASVYSASKLAAEEFPDLDVSLRGTISICRRVQDPLAELVKIDPKSIGVGQYQHDIPQKGLESTLTEVVESVVNRVGVDINHASPALLSYISGISKTQAQVIYDHVQKEKLKSREEISKIKGIGPKTFEQAAGFLRIIDEPLNPLDSTGIHPESYDIALLLLNYLNFSLTDILIPEKRNTLNNLLDNLDRKKFLLSQSQKAGDYTLNDVINALKSPFRDPREDLQAPILRTNLVDMDSLEEGMELSGTVKNVTSFGAFIDIGIKINGLVHVSELANRFVDNPFEIVKPGERVKVKIISIEKERNRIGLSMKQTEEAMKNKQEGFSKKKGRNVTRDVVKQSQVPTKGKFSLNDLKLSMDSNYNKKKR
ncbi:MAG: 30S ribosomal protein S1 [Candidatus Heimdallarchaeota archaeon LC_3]|nr:MAG: 30S ribosomal protein S1 [Candidatus Heimdallarchaeota archaeon LC_3]